MGRSSRKRVVGESASNVGPPAPRGLRTVRSSVGGHEFAVLAFPVREPARALESLTVAERAVATLVIEGLSNAEIATRRGTSVRTVANQLQSLYRKLNVASRLELARLGLATRH